MKFASLRAFLPAAVLAFAGAAQANQIVLEGSDATTFHQDVLYTQQLINFMRNSSATPALPVLVIGTGSISASVTGVVKISTYSLTGQNLANYSGLYITSPGGCCGAPDGSTSISAADKTAIAAAEALGMSLTIENYGGGPTWGPVLPAAVNAIVPAAIGGITSYGTAGGPTCTDNEVVNATGLAFGFVQPPVLGCYEHQGYRVADFAALGFVSLFNADPAYFGVGAGGVALGSALLAFGGILGTPPTAAPEPESIALLGLGLAAFAIARRRKAK